MISLMSSHYDIDKKKFRNICQKNVIKKLSFLGGKKSLKELITPNHSTEFGSDTLSLVEK